MADVHLSATEEDEERQGKKWEKSIRCTVCYLVVFVSYGQLTQFFPEVSNYKLYYAQVNQTF